MKKLLKSLSLVLLLLSGLLLVACGPQGGGSDPGSDPNPGPGPGPVDPPAPVTAFYQVSPDVIQASSTERYMVYTTNKTSGEEDSCVAVKVGTLVEGKWEYDEGTIVLEGKEGAWDEYILSASICKGSFKSGNNKYSWLLVYAATSKENGTCAQIGIAVANSVNAPFTRVGDAPIIAYTQQQFAGCYAPSVINYNKVSGIRIFYTYADAYGHFAYFADADMSDLNNISIDKAIVTNQSETLASGDAVLMFPNADWAYDADHSQFVFVKDYSPSAATAPSFAYQIEFGKIAEDELYTTDKGAGLISMGLFSNMELEDGFERVYSASIISDVYGHVLAGNKVEFAYNVCDLAAENEDYIFSQKILFSSFDLD